MALNEFLRATGELITRIEEVPPDQTDRLKYLRENFPGLTEEEQSDLAALPLNKLSLYTRSIFSIEASILRNRLRRTVRTIEQGWKDCRSEPFSLRDLARLMKIEYPWKGYETVGLLESFRQFIATKLSDLLDNTPWLSDLCTYEIALYRVRRSPKEDADVSESLQISDLEQFTVEEFLELPVTIPRRVVPIALHVTALTGEESSPPTTRFALIARDRRFSVRTVEVIKPVYELFTASDRQQLFALGELAQVVLHDSSEEPAMQFNKFYSTVRELLEAGCLIAALPL